MKRLQRFFSRPKSKPQTGEGAIGSHSQTAAQAPVKMTATATNSTLTIALRNDSSSSNVYAYITGQAIDNNNALILMQADAVTPYYPSSPSSPGAHLAVNCAISLGNPGNTVQAQIPHIAGGRVWFSVDGQITFLLNPGPALVEPSVSNSSDPSIHVNWGFCEFTWNSSQLYANISYVDFVSLPISLDLSTVSSGSQHVSGMGTNGLAQIASGLQSQTAKDGKPWSSLIVPKQNSTQPLRVLSPNTGAVGNPNLFSGYFEPYVSQVYAQYTTQNLSVDTQASYGVLSAQVSNAALKCGDSSFAKPSTADIFSCSTGPFATGSDAERNTIIPRLAAAFNRSTYLASSAVPSAENLYYQNAITNHYARVVHAANLDGKGYAFPYDDVQPTGGADQSGKIQAGDPQLWTIAVGGSRATA